MRTILRLLALLCLVGSAAMYGTQTGEAWQELDEGLEVGEFKAPIKASVGDSRITVVRVNPQHFEFSVLAASQIDSIGLTTREWCERYGLVGAVNAGMYAKDYLTHVGYMKINDRVLNGSIRKDYKAALVCNPTDPGSREARLVDMECEDFAAVAGRYRTVVQNLRMISCRRGNVWSRQNRRWSTAALATDSKGRLLFVFCQSPYSVYELNEMLLELPLDLSRAMYLEGGAPASFYLSYEGVTIERHGLYETGTGEGGGLVIAHRLPNVIGFRRK